MKRLILLLALASAPALARDDCQSTCSTVKTQCAKSCEDATKNKKEKATCVSQGCSAAVAQCESSCKGANAKHK